MKELPIEISKRLQVISLQMAQHEVLGLRNLSPELEEMVYQFLSKMIMNNKLVFITEMPNFSHNGKLYQCPTFKVDNIEIFNSILQNKFDEDKEVFCYYSLSLSPTMYHPTTYTPSHAIMLRGAFIPVRDDYELKDLIDRDKQIDQILN